MSVESDAGNHMTGTEETAYFTWLETHIRDTEHLKTLQNDIYATNPDIFRMMGDAAAELAPGDPVAHATYFGSFLLIAAEMRLTEVLVPIG